jgi:hypothetical protein
MTQPVEVRHLHEFTSKCLKLINLLGAHALQCARSVPAILGTPDLREVRARVVAWAQREIEVDVDKYPGEASPMVLTDADMDPAVRSEYFLYYRTILQLLAFLTLELSKAVEKERFPPRLDMRRVVYGFMQNKIQAFLQA